MKLTQEHDLEEWKIQIWHLGRRGCPSAWGQALLPMACKARGMKTMAGPTCLETSCPFLYCTVPFSAKT